MAQTPQMADLQYLTIEVQGTQHPCTNSKNHNQVTTQHVPLLLFRSKTGQPDAALCGSAWSLVFRVAVVAQFLVGAWWLRNMLHAAIPHLWRGKNGHTSVHTNMFMNWTLHLIQKTSKKKGQIPRCLSSSSSSSSSSSLPSYHPRPGRAHSSVQIWGAKYLLGGLGPPLSSLEPPASKANSCMKICTANHHEICKLSKHPGKISVSVAQHISGSSAFTSACLGREGADECTVPKLAFSSCLARPETHIICSQWYLQRAVQYI